MLPLHLQGKKSGSSVEPSPLHIRHVSGSDACASEGFARGPFAAEEDIRRRVLGNRTGSGAGKGSGKPSITASSVGSGAWLMGTPFDVMARLV